MRDSGDAHTLGARSARRGLRVNDKKEGEELAHLTELFIRDRVNIHFHVWTFKEMSEMFAAARDQVGLPIDIKMAFLDPPCLEVVWVLEVTKSAA